MHGLAETDSVWTAFLRPPLLTFSGDQPCSTAIGRSISAVSSSVTKALKGSRSEPAREAWKGAFMSTCLLVVLVAGSGWRPVGWLSRYVLTARPATTTAPSPEASRPWTRSSGLAIIAARLELIAQP